MQFLNNLLNRATEETVIEAVAQEETTAPHNVEAGEWFTSKEHYLEFTAAFKKSAQDKNLTSAHFLLYAILRNRDWNKGWTLPTNKGKQIEHGYKKSNAFYQLKSPAGERHLLAPFDGTITTEMLMAIRENLDKIRENA